MSALSFTPLLNSLVDRQAITNFSQPTLTTNATGNALQVICAWPLSGQYGPGSRVLYYAFIATTIFARKAEWLRNASFAATVLFPAVAAVHAVVLTSLHVAGAVDMDIYGAFQLCSIGILAAPITIRLSPTYFSLPGRNVIFGWTGLILAGLLSLTVEFYRTTASKCMYDDSGSSISPNPEEFPYNNATCGLICSVEQGPYSLIRTGSTNNIYVIPIPDTLTFGTATVFAAGACVPAILLLTFQWRKILDLNWKKRFSFRDEEERIGEPIDGTNGATTRKMKQVEDLIKVFLRAIETAIFIAALLAVLFIGERNFFSSQVIYQNEPMSSIGQWAPVVGTGFALLVSFVEGSLHKRKGHSSHSVEEDHRNGTSIPSSMRSTSHHAPRSPQSHSQLPSPLQLPQASGRPHFRMLPAESTPIELQSPGLSSALGSPENIQRQRRHTIQGLPSAVYHSSL